MASFATWYVYSSIRFFVLVLNVAGAAISELASFLAGALGGMIVGAIGFVITDIIASAITGAIERKQLNEAIDALNEFRNKVADPLLNAATQLAGVVQAIKNGVYKVSDSLLIFRNPDGTYQVIQVAPSSPSVHVALVRRDFSDCLNSDVHANGAGQSAGGSLVVTRKDAENFRVDVRLETCVPNTRYQFFLKCHRILGAVVTDSAGAGTGSFTFGAQEVGPRWAFDMYPEGAPLGNKYQSD